MPSGFGFNRKGRSLGFQSEFGQLGAHPFGDPRPPVVAGPGMLIRHLPGGRIAVEAKKKRGGGGTTADIQPFDVTVTLDSGAGDPETADRLVTVQAGVVNNLLPTNMFSVGATPASGSRYVCLDVTFADGQATSALLSMDTSAPGATLVTVTAPPTSFKILLAVIVDGVVFQIRHGNLTCTSSELFRVDKAAPAAPGELAYDSYWQWNVSTS